MKPKSVLVSLDPFSLPRVSSDHEALGALAAQHFLEHGFTNFAWYASASSHVHDLRYKGFRKALKGFPVGREILNQRILRAKRLLKDESTPLNAIARFCGFCNASYFTNTFRRETDLVPKVWRKRL